MDNHKNNNAEQLMSFRQISIILSAVIFLFAGMFLLGGWALGAGPAAEPAQQTRQTADQPDALFTMDAHTHMMNRQLHLGGTLGDRYPKAQVDLPRIREGSVDALFFSLYTPEPYYNDRFELKQTLRLLEMALQQISDNDQIEVARNASDIERISRLGKTAAFLDLEGTYDLDGNVWVLRSLYRLGLRSLMLSGHNEDTNFADACCDEHRWGGINQHGRALIQEMNRLGMVINVAHGSSETILQAVETSKDPILYSHGGLRHFVNIQRNISDKAAKAIAANGGVFGLQIGNTFNNTSKAYKEYRDSKAYKAYKEEYRRQNITSDNPSRSAKTEESRRPNEQKPNSSFEKLTWSLAGNYPVSPCCPVPDSVRMSVSDLVEVIDYAVELVGEDHVAIGADFGGAVFPPFGIDDIGDYSKITEGLQRKGYSKERIHKIMGGNLLRLIREVTE